MQNVYLYWNMWFFQSTNLICQHHPILLQQAAKKVNADRSTSASSIVKEQANMAHTTAVWWNRGKPRRLSHSIQQSSRADHFFCEGCKCLACYIRPFPAQVGRTPTSGAASCEGVTSQTNQKPALREHYDRRAGYIYPRMQSTSSTHSGESGTGSS